MAQITDTSIGIEIANISTLDPGGAAVIEKDELQQVLTSLKDSKLSGFVKTVGVAYVESNGSNSTGEVGNPYRPFLTIDAALDATAALSARVIHIGLGTFNKWTIVKVLDNTWFKGSGKPMVNNSATPSTYSLITVTAPTALVGGTILNGTCWIPYNKHNVHVTDLGVDCGSTWCDTFNGGTAVDALVIPANTGAGNFTNNGRELRKNILVRNVTTIVKTPASLIHSCLLENCYNPYVENVETWNGFAGFVSKNVGGIFNNIFSNNSDLYNIIIKQNDYSYSHNTTLSNFQVRGGAGVAIHNEDGDNSLGMIGIKLINGKISGTTYGVKQIGNRLERLNIIGVDVESCSGNGFEFSDIRNSKINGCLVYGAAGKGFLTAGRNFRVQNCGAYSITGNAFEASGNSASERAILTDNDAPGGTVVATGSFVYGNSNFYNALTGTINAV